MILNGKRIPIMILIINALVLFTLFYTPTIFQHKMIQKPTYI